ncbi:dynamin family protein [Leptolyngbya sp. BC1307]|uniref:dynamin family protein n=1 Tax=Leptolyngbya sp. BC1307 TaxID=2029589 RepID=UPI000EFB46CA|nr:dynamin family protein [Leptolyngbya sp. BC1307]
MADDIKAIFASVKEEAKDFSTALWQCCEKIYNELPQNYEADIDPELQLTFLTDKLNQAVETLCDGLDNPTLILATTGTTSSGKSTLVNLLCGAELMPVSVQEMSAGVVTIEYSDQKAIKIAETPGAQWECGTWYNVSNEDIYSRLERVMTTYRNIREEGGIDITCPQSTIYYPFRLVSEAGLLDLPEGTTVKIMDLPGLAGVNDDEGNTEAIRRCKEALCLVTYNSAETDKAKVASLLQEIVDQVKELGGSPARMLFILNRIDVFRGDNNWPESEELFCSKTGQNIRNKLKEHLGEYESEIDDVEIVKLSSLPALLSLEMVNGSEAGKIEASEKLDSFFGKLMPKDILNDLPRQADRWVAHDRQRLYDALWLETNAEAFHQHLKQHIQNEYPQLILPQILEKFKDDAVFKLIEWASQTTSAVINSSEEKYQAECERIDNIRVNLDQSISQKAQALKKPFDDIEKILQDALNKKAGAEDPIYKLTEILGKPDCFGPGISAQLKPLYDWSIVLASAIGKIVSSILRSLVGGRSILGDKAFEYAKPTNVTLLDGRIKDLVKENYLNYAGKKFQARTQEEKEKLEKLNRNLNELSIVLVSIVDDVAKKVLGREISRVEEALEKLFKFHLESLKESVADIAPDLGINFSQTELIKIEFSAIPSFSFKGGFPVVKESYKEPVTEKVGTKRVFFFFEEDVYETKMEKRSRDNATIPSFEDIERGWRFQKGDGEKEVLRQISNWWLKQLEEFNSGIEEFQSDVMKRYQERLNLAHRDSTTDYENKMEIWQPLSEEALLVSSRVNQLGTKWKSSEKRSKP